MHAVQRIMWLLSLVLSAMLLLYIICIPHARVGGITGEAVVVEDSEYYLPFVPRWSSLVF